MRIEKQNIPSATRSKVNSRFRNFSTDIDDLTRKLKDLSSDRKALFGDRYTDDPSSHDAQLEQRQQLLSGTDRLDRSSQRLRESQRIALETEDIGRGTLADLHTQRETIEHTRTGLLESEGYVDRSVKTLRGMARRYFILGELLMRFQTRTDQLAGWLQIGL
jgi:vesicle transport through interaction with t-SNAREs protein 1